MSDVKIDRRNVLKGALLGAITLRALTVDEAKAAAALVKLTESDPTAKALGYHSNAKAVDIAKYKTYKPDQTCLNCVQLQAGTGTDRGCNLFPGKSVNINGWCSVWVKKA